MPSSTDIQNPPRTKLGFLDLPAEVRLQVYPHLFICTKILHGWVETDEFHEDGYRIRYPAEILRLSPLVLIASSKKGANPSTVHRGLNWDRWEYGSDVWYQRGSLHPQILYTCRTVWQEATPILYRENAFYFWSGSSYLDDIGRMVAGTRDGGVEPSTDEEVLYGSRQLMNYDVDCWEDQGHVPQLIRSSTFAAFLRKVGSYNASLIRSLILHSNSVHEAAEDIVLATELCTQHVPDLRSFKMRVQKKWVDRYESPDYYHPNYNSPFWANGPFKPMYTSLQYFVRRIHGLQEFKYIECPNTQLRFVERNGMADLRRLENAVTARAKGRKEQEDARWRAKRNGLNEKMKEDDCLEGFREFWRLCPDMPVVQPAPIDCIEDDVAIFEMEL
ncbi:MAG: hypothetical protein Q9218_007407 [Villophora microphyllina]